MKNIVPLLTIALGTFLVTGAAYAGDPLAVPLPEPMSMSLLAGGIVAIAAVKRMRRK